MAAVDVFSITGKIAVDYSEATSNLNSVKESAKKTAESLEDVDDAADDAGDSVEDAGDAADDADDQFSTWQVTLANLASQAITALVSKCKELAEQIVDLGIETETSFAQLETIAGSENIDNLTASIRELSKETGVSSSELAIVAYNAISAGSSAEEAMDMVTAATQLGVAGFTDADSALSVLSTAMNSYGDAAGTAAEISDSLIMVQNLGVTTIGQLSTSMGKAIATGSAYSVSLGNLESAYVSVTKAGISTEEATTYLNSMMNELGDSGSDVSAILQKQTKKTFTELMEEGYSLGDVLGILYEACDKDSTALMNLWSSAEAGKASNAIINQGLEEFNENLETITNSSGATESAYATMADTMETKISIMQQGFADLGLKIYDGLEAPLSSAISFVTNRVIPGIEKLMDNFDSIAPVLGTVAVAVGVYEVAVNAANIAQTAAAVSATALASPILAIVAVVGVLSAAFMTLWNTNDGFRTAILETWNTICESVSGFINGIIERLDALGISFTSTGSIIGDLQLIWESFCEILAPIFEGAFNAVQIILSTVLNTILGLWDFWAAVFQGDWEGAWEAIVNLFFNLINGLITFVTNALNTIGNVIGIGLEAIGTNWEEVWTAITTFFQNAWDKISSVLSTAMELVNALLSGDLETAKGIVDNVLNNILDSFSNIFESAKNVVSNALENIKSMFNFEWSLPELKMPHVSISGEFSLMPLSVPTFSVDWYKKAMDGGMIMNSPTIFGYNAETDQLMGGGEAGSETVVGTENLMEMITAAVNKSGSTELIQIVELLQYIVDWLGSGNFRDVLIDVLTKYVKFEYNDRELGRLVKKYA